MTHTPAPIDDLVTGIRATLGEDLVGLYLSHASAIAAGIILSGVVGERFVLRVGAGFAARAGAAGLGLASLVVAFAPNVVASLLAAFVLGVEAWPLVEVVALVSIGVLFVTREDSSPA